MYLLSSFSKFDIGNIGCKKDSICRKGHLIFIHIPNDLLKVFIDIYFKILFKTVWLKYYLQYYVFIHRNLIIGILNGDKHLKTNVLWHYILQMTLSTSFSALPLASSPPSSIVARQPAVAGDNNNRGHHHLCVDLSSHTGPSIAQCKQPHLAASTADSKPNVC